MEQRTIFATVLILVIAAGIFYVGTHWTELSRNEIRVEYPDGCIEVFINMELTTPICEEGRRLEESSSTNFSDLEKYKNLKTPTFGNTTWNT